MLYIGIQYANVLQLNLSHEIRVTSIQALSCVTSTKQRKYKHD